MLMGKAGTEAGPVLVQAADRRDPAKDFVALHPLDEGPEVGGELQAGVAAVSLPAHKALCIEQSRRYSHQRYYRRVDAGHEERAICATPPPAPAIRHGGSRSHFRAR